MSKFTDKPGLKKEGLKFPDIPGFHVLWNLVQNRNGSTRVVQWSNIQSRDVSRGGGPFSQGDRYMYTEQGWTQGKGPGVRHTEQK